MRSYQSCISPTDTNYVADRFLSAGTEIACLVKRSFCIVDVEQLAKPVHIGANECGRRAAEVIVISPEAVTLKVL